MNKAKTAALTEPEAAELQWAYQHLEHPSLAARLSSLLASPIGEVVAFLPKQWQRLLNKTAEASIYFALKTAIMSTMPLGTLGPIGTIRAHNWFHKATAVSAGAAGGFAGPILLLAEIPFTTVLMLRSIADIACSEGEDLTVRESRIACAQVFALGGRTREDESADVGYYGLRITLGLHFERDILEFAAGAEGPHIPAIIQMTRAIAARFGVVISETMAVRMVPIAGAVSGAMLNLIFMSHFQDMARGHFIVRRLERKYSVDAIRTAYQRLEAEEAEAEAGFSPVTGW